MMRLFRRLPYPPARQWRPVLLLLALTLPAIACGLFNPLYNRNNEIRLAVYDYERAQRGPVDELVLAFNRDEPRVKFEGQNENGGRTVWLQDLAAREFFDLRRPDSTFLYIQNIDYLDDYRQAMVTVYRGDGVSYEGRELTLISNDDGQWTVTGEVLLNDSPAQ
jgi:hypothetical protein